MAKPILELISETVVNRVKNITVTNGYEFTIAFAQLVDRNKNQWQPEPLAIYVQEAGIEKVPELCYPGNPPRVAYEAMFEITGFAGALDQDKDEVGAIDRSVTDTQMMAAIPKALTNNDAAEWQTFGGYAINANIDSIETIDSPGHDGARVMLGVIYRTSEIDPFTQ